MAEWLRTVQLDSGAFPSGTGGTGSPSVFNTGQIVFGMVRTHEETKEEPYRRAAREACDWLVDQQAADGYWDRHDYLGEVHAYSTRVAWALLEAAELLPERADIYREAARRNFEWAVGLQAENGWFDRAGFDAESTPFLHTIAYTVRGLLEGAIALEHRDFTAAARRSADALRSIQERHGTLKGAYDASWSPSWYYCLTGNAQMAIVWLRLYQVTGERSYLSAAREAIEFLKRRQVLAPTPIIRGALAGSYPIVGSYQALRFPNWAAKFFADALLLLRAIEDADRSTTSESWIASG